MKLRRALHLFTDNFSGTYKLLLYRFVSQILFVGLIYVILSLGLHSILTSAEVDNIFALAKEFIRAIVTGNSAYLVTFQDEFLEAMKELSLLLANEIGSIVGSLIGVCLMYLLLRFVNGTAVFAIGNMVNDKMAFYSKTKFSTAYFKNIGQAMLYEVMYVPLSFVYDALAVVFCWFFFFYTPSLMPTHGFLSVLFGVSITIAVFILLEAVKMALISAWIPAVVTGKSVVEGFKSCFKNCKTGFWGRFSTYLVTLYLLFMLNVMFAICSLGSFLIISLPASFVFILCLQLVYYYEDNRMKYFVAFNTVSEHEDIPNVIEDKSDTEEETSDGTEE